LKLCLGVLVLLPALVRAGEQATLSGRVIAVSNGQGVAQSAVTLTFATVSNGPTAITVFSDEQGAFRMPLHVSAIPADASLAAHKLGYKQVDPASAAVQVKSGAPAGSYETRLYLDPVANIAGQVPASAWLAQGAPGDAKNITLTSCSSCHQVPSPKMREYAAKIEAVRGGPDGDRQAIEEWRKVVRHESWRTIVTYMRSHHSAVFPLDSAMTLDAVDWPTAQNADYNFFNARQGEVVASYLAANFPRSTASLRNDAYDYGAALGVSPRTVIREFAFPAEALVRELVPAPRSPYLWGADVRRNLLVRLDPRNGATKWIGVDFKGSTGPHTIAPDDDGNLWVTMVDNDQFGRFDPRTERWRLWTLRPSSLPDTASMAGAAIVHDMSIDSRGHMARDASGNIWLTMVGTNQMGTLNPQSGYIAFYDTNTIAGFSPINHLIYSTVLSADGQRAWYSQVNGSVGCIDTRTKKVVGLIEFPEGTGPRRMARDNAGHLWVALFGSGQVARIDMKQARVIATFDLPDRAAAPYAVTWDERRQAVWVANANSDAIYRLDPRSAKDFHQRTPTMSRIAVPSIISSTEVPRSGSVMTSAAGARIMSSGASSQRRRPTSSSGR
jgi:streptogramin lyase